LPELAHRVDDEGIAVLDQVLRSHGQPSAPCARLSLCPSAAGGDHPAAG
jgi:hypothetical protein